MSTRTRIFVTRIFVVALALALLVGCVNGNPVAPIATCDVDAPIDTVSVSDTVPLPAPCVNGRGTIRTTVRP